MAIPLPSLITPQTVLFDSNPKGRASRCYAPLVWNNQTAWLDALRCIPKIFVALVNLVLTRPSSSNNKNAA